jgi:hypothetical protein
VLVTGAIVGSVQGFLEVNRRGGVRRPEGGRDDRQAASKTHGPEVGGTALLGTADHHRIVALKTAFLGQRHPSPQQVYLDQNVPLKART